MAGVGDEVGAHLCELVLLGQVAERDHRERQAAANLAAAEPGHCRGDAALHGHALVEIDDDGLVGGDGLLDRVVQLWVARELAQRLAGANLREEFLEACVEVHDIEIVIEGDGSVGHGVEQKSPALRVTILGAALAAPRTVGLLEGGAVIVVVGIGRAVSDDDHRHRGSRPRPSHPERPAANHSPRNRRATTPSARAWGAAGALARRADWVRSTIDRVADCHGASRRGSNMGPHIASICIIPSTLTMHRPGPLRRSWFACSGLHDSQRTDQGSW